VVTSAAYEHLGLDRKANGNDGLLF
jgi:hypothetical protein